MRRLFRILLVCAIFAAAGASGSRASQRLRLIPQLQPGQTLIYLVSYQSGRTIKTQSRFASPDQPATTRLGVEGKLRVEVLAHDTQGYRLRTKFDAQDGSTAAEGGLGYKAGETPANAKDTRWVEFTLREDGSVSQLSGLDALPQEQQAAWREWIARFASPMVYPKKGVERGEKWEKEEAETAPSPIAGLVWRRKSEYVRDEPCPAAGRTPKGDLVESLSKTESCAVILTTAALKQNSSRKDSTPEDYKLNHLQTKGTASGTNETILYISRSTWLVMRSTENDKQAMDVVVSLADGSNQVHYNISATSRARLLILSVPAPARR
jgi:hypothetical protein